jgi:hypothetical protein
MKRAYLLAAALPAAAALTGCQGAGGGADIARVGTPTRSAAVSAAMIHAKQQQDQQQQPLNNFETRCYQKSRGLRCQTNSN